MSDGMSNLEMRITRFEELLEQMKSETREAHSALKQVQHERREIERLLQKGIQKMVDDKIGELVRKELDELGPKMKEWSGSLYGKVGSEIDKLIDLSLGEEFAKEHGRTSIRPLLAIKLKEWLREMIMNEGLVLE